MHVGGVRGTPRTLSESADKSGAQLMLMNPQWNKGKGNIISDFGAWAWTDLAGLTVLD